MKVRLLAPLRDLGLAYCVVSAGVSLESGVLQTQGEKAVRHYFLPVSRRRKTLRERFADLADDWRTGRPAASSSVRQLAMHPAYQAIIGMGEDAVPLIIGELERKPDHWFWALQAITGKDPVKPDHAGRMRLMAQDWAEWAQAAGI